MEEDLAIKLAGTCKNELGSVLNIDTMKNEIIEGTYHSNTGKPTQQDLLLLEECIKKQ